MSGPQRHAAARPPAMPRILAIVAGLLIASACGQGSQASPPSSRVAPPDASDVPASVAASASVSSAGPSVAVQPPGLLVFDRYDGAFGAEGPYLGTFITRSDGTDERALTVPIESVGLIPAWSPDSRRLLLTTWLAPKGPARPAIINADGSGFVRLEPPDAAGDDLGCSDWSPDGELIACSVSGTKPDPDGIYTLRPDGIGLARLTTSPFHTTRGTAGECGGGDGHGVFSPDGSKIAFIRQRCGAGANPSSDESSAIFVMNRDGTGLREIVPQGAVKSHPGTQISWSPDGTTIAFGSQAGELFLVQPDGTGLTQIRLPSDLGSHHAYGPDWSPDGTRIVFSMYVDSERSTDLYSVARDGSSLVRITSADGAENFASWGPSPGP